MYSSLVVRALNEAEHLPRLFDSLAKQTVTPDEVILVDSGSTDRSVGIAETNGASVVHIPPGDFTFGGSLNAGCERAKGDILIFASAHTYPQDDHWIERLLHPFENDQVAISYGGQDGDEDSNFSEVQLMKDWFPEESNPDQREPFCNNANCAVRRTVWEQHPYDEALTGLEDIAFGRQALAAGHKIAYVADARIVHIHREEFGQTLNRYRREAIAYAEIFGPANLGVRRSAGLFAHNLASDLRTARREGVLMRQVGHATRFRAAQFAGAYAGHKSHTGDGADVVRRMYYPRPK